MPSLAPMNDELGVTVSSFRVYRPRGTRSYPGAGVVSPARRSGQRRNVVLIASEVAAPRCEWRFNERKGAKSAFGKQGVDVLMKLQTNRVVAPQPGKAGRPVGAMRASFAERAERARLRTECLFRRCLQKE